MVNLTKFPASSIVSYCQCITEIFFHSKWLMYIKNILSDSDLPCYWLNQANITLNISKTVKLKLTELSSLSWKEAVLVFESPKCLNYRILNNILVFKITLIFYQMICLKLFATSDH